MQCTSLSLPVRNDTATILTNVGLVSNIQVLPPQYITTALPGDVLTFTHTVLNQGNNVETVRLIPSAGAAGLSTAVVADTTRGLTATYALNPSESITVLLRTTILDTAAGGGVANPGLIAQSVADPLVKGEAINLITIGYVPGTRFVAIGGDDGLNGGNNCLVRLSPCATIQHAVDQASDGDDILIAAGTYTDLITRTVGSDALAQTVFVNKSVNIRGGYTVNEALPFSSVAPITNAVRIDGEDHHRVIYIAAGQTAALSGLFLENGNATGGGQDTLFEYGGGIYNAGSNLTITSTWVLSNGARFGAGLYHVDGTLSVHNAVFANGQTNVSGNIGAGGGLYVVTGTALLENSTFAANMVGLPACCNRDERPTAQGDGGAIYQTGGSLALYNNIFAGNILEVGSAGSAVFATGTVVANDYNLYYNNIGSASPTTFALGANHVVGDPHFADAFFHITASSAAKDSGWSGVSSASSVDFELDIRPDGPAYDIGADERIQQAGFVFIPLNQTAVFNPGSPYTYTHFITNTGDGADTYTFTRSSSSVSGSGWTHSLAPAQVSLAMGESATITLVITGTSPGDIDTTTLTATPLVGSGPQSVVDTSIISSTAAVDIAPIAAALAIRVQLSSIHIRLPTQAMD